MYDMIEFIIPCGGYSTRNYPHSKNGTHKSLMPFGDARLIDFVLKDIIAMGGRHITIVCSSQKVIDAFQFSLETDHITEEKLRHNGRETIADILKETFLPADTDLKFIIQERPKGTAQVLGLAHRLSPDRAGVMIFPDDIIISKNEKSSHLKRIVDYFLQNQRRILLTGVEQEDVSNNAVIIDGKLIEKPKHPTNKIAGYSPIILPKETMDFIEKQTIELGKTGIMPHGEGSREWVYVDGINAFLNENDNAAHFQVEMFLKKEEDLLLDTGSLPLYEKAQLRVLLTLSRFREENKAFVKQLLDLS